MEDIHNIEGSLGRHGVYGGSLDAMPGLRRFLDLAERKDGLLPS